MKKRYNVRRITSRRSYSTIELSELLGAHQQTIRLWRVRGMQAIDETKHSPLFMGSEIRQFLSKGQADQKVKLADDEYYCMHCKGARCAVEVKIVDTGAMIGRGKSSMRREGRCCECGLRVRRFYAKPVNILAEGKGIILEHPPSL